MSPYPLVNIQKLWKIIMFDRKNSLEISINGHFPCRKLFNDQAANPLLLSVAQPRGAAHGQLCSCRGQAKAKGIGWACSMDSTEARNTKLSCKPWYPHQIPKNSLKTPDIIFKKEISHIVSFIPIQSTCLMIECMGYKFWPPKSTDTTRVFGQNDSTNSAMRTKLSRIM